MSFRFMRVIVFFDLPSVTSAELREYRHFRKSLLKNGFIMMQESVYSKLALNQTVADAIMKSVRDFKPSAGIVQMLTVTEKQYQKIEYVVGTKSSIVVDSTDRLVIV